jgi:hypothetical protein
VVGVGRSAKNSYHAASALEAEAALLSLAQELDRTRPAAAASVREGMYALSARLPNLSDPSCTLIRSAQPDAHRTATDVPELGTTSAMMRSVSFG